ncbi:S1/P1 nuclease [Nafulsella turpanensis]|uniref:S1/P1 nuclease n=1 Tax=Nafulsella turpanensis TaxID=1265690 RepID=UPI000348B723|nr:S1/P1 nuclease [Nafulsella turpanensis]
MKKVLSLCLLLPLFIGQAYAWGQNGHRVVGLVAQQHLSKKAKKKIMQLLDENSLAEVSVWMDDIKSDDAYDHTHDWHWVTVPPQMKYEDTEKNPNGDLIMKIEEIVSALKKGGLTAEQEEEYLKFLVHLVGDLHQPMHVGTGEDAGGNAVKVEWFGDRSNLHRVWDSEMIDSKDLSFTEIARFLGEPEKSQVKQWQSTSVRDWAYESAAYLPEAYELPENGRLGYQYMYEHYDVVEKRLLQAGVRLAGLLNEIYG